MANTWASEAAHSYFRHCKGHFEWFVLIRTPLIWTPLWVMSGSMLRVRPVLLSGARISDHRDGFIEQPFKQLPAAVLSVTRAFRECA